LTFFDVLGDYFISHEKSSLAKSTRPRPFHAIRKTEYVRAAAFQTRGY